MTNKEYMMNLDETRSFLAKANLPTSEEVEVWMNNEFQEDDEFWCAIEEVAKYLTNHVNYPHLKERACNSFQNHDWAID